MESPDEGLVDEGGRIVGGTIFDLLFSRRLLIIDDHMIWNYRTQLEAISAARNLPRQQ